MGRKFSRLKDIVNIQHLTDTGKTKDGKQSGTGSGGAGKLEEIYNKSIFSGIAILFCAWGLSTLIILFFLSEKSDHYLKRQFLYTNSILVIPFLAFFILAAFLIFIIRKKLESFLIDNKKWLYPLAVILLFICQCIYSYNAFFYSDWDPAGVLAGTYHIFRGEYDEISLDYFSAHPNNLMLVFIYGIVLRISMLFGSGSILMLLIFQCAIFTLTGVILYKIAASLSGGEILPVCAWLLFVLTLGFSPWLIITYSDEVGIIFPVVTLWIYLGILGRERASIALRKLVRYYKSHRNRGDGDKQEGYKKNAVVRLIKSKQFLWAILGAWAMLGYSIKPQTLIPVIAILILELPRIFWKRLFLFLIGLFSFYLMVSGLIIPSLHIELDRNKAFGMEHYFMMGLNDGTDGVYSNEDTEFTNSFPDPGERAKADMLLADERLKQYGFKGLLRHLVRKSLVNFNDGSFAWGIDGYFFAERMAEGLPALEEGPLTAFIWSFIRDDGPRFPLFLSFCQGLWLSVLFLASLSGIYGIRHSFYKGGKNALPHAENCEKAKKIRTLALLWLSVIGITLFELLFEAKARYIFIAYPLFVLLAAMGAAGTVQIRAKFMAYY
ncbi:MAG: hypothetical protein J6O55_06290 [Lachnospiraceae bacterium]|nr:hypothetical protein [Lachnospiraceae bacterium]